MRLLGISGSLRGTSLNTQLVQMARDSETVRDFRLADIRLPLFDEDLEGHAAIALSVDHLRRDLLWADAVLIATPEYNKNLPGGLKNALDWISRDPARPLWGKPVAICSVAAGKGGGVQAQYSLRHCLTPFQPLIPPGPEVAISTGGEQSFADTERVRTRLFRLLDALAAQLPHDEIRLKA